LPQYGNYVSDHRSPFEERWGGWFITGKTGSRHMGNIMLEPNGMPDPDSRGSRELATLNGKFDLQGYPSPYSDVAALMVLNHQARMTNLLTRIGWEMRIALAAQERVPGTRASAERLIAANATELVDYLLFVDEARMSGDFESTSGFAKKFAESGPRDRRGRSLRELDLSKRLFRYSCSYMIYSPLLEGLPPAARDAIYARLWAVLSGAERAAKYSRLSSADRAAIVGILLETKRDLPAYYRPLER
jgi:hypothetical protein